MKTLTPDELLVGIHKAIGNAEQLVREADLLLSGGAYARSFTLSQFALEELAKVNMLWAAARRLVLGFKVDWPDLDRGLRSHERKTMSDQIAQATFSAQDRPPPLKKATVMNEARVRNRLKNDSIYVGLRGRDFVAPAELISEAVAREHLTEALDRVSVVAVSQNELDGQLHAVDEDMRAAIAMLQELFAAGKSQELEDLFNSSLEMIRATPGWTEAVSRMREHLAH